MKKLNMNIIELNQVEITNVAGGFGWETIGYIGAGIAILAVSCSICGFCILFFEWHE